MVANPIAAVPDEQADAMTWFLPVSPKWIERWLDSELNMHLGTSSAARREGRGEIRFGRALGLMAFAVSAAGDHGEGCPGEASRDPSSRRACAMLPAR